MKASLTARAMKWCASAHRALLPSMFALSALFAGHDARAQTKPVKKVDLPAPAVANVGLAKAVTLVVPNHEAPSVTPHANDYLWVSAFATHQGQRVAGLPLRFSLQGRTCSGTTDTFGRASCRLPVIDVHREPLVVRFSGNQNYQAAQAESPFQGRQSRVRVSLQTTNAPAITAEPGTFPRDAVRSRARVVGGSNAPIALYMNGQLIGLLSPNREHVVWHEKTLQNADLAGFYTRGQLRAGQLDFVTASGPIATGASAVYVRDDSVYNPCETFLKSPEAFPDWKPPDHRKKCIARPATNASVLQREPMTVRVRRSQPNQVQVVTAGRLTARLVTPSRPPNNASCTYPGCESTCWRVEYSPETGPSSGPSYRRLLQNTCTPGAAVAFNSVEIADHGFDAVALWDRCASAAGAGGWNHTVRDTKTMNFRGLFHFRDVYCQNGCSGKNFKRHESDYPIYEHLPFQQTIVLECRE